ncbi:hypothetical protein GWI33_010749 [Rhynchophorus ferrugineus]|uniref:Uncharacterized protein n=1 Tax=Rhynchophorus ferrugineus TaxID=354439 RepID=A0A834IUH7_RHYFE|nr:hypothetical protein GWI33_010749 [Rhynchophorus ferrugineus]
MRMLQVIHCTFLCLSAVLLEHTVPTIPYLLAGGATLPKGLARTLATVQKVPFPIMERKWPPIERKEENPPVKKFPEHKIIGILNESFDTYFDPTNGLWGILDSEKCRATENGN